MISKHRFRASLQRNECPFCDDKLTYYDGALGYEAYLCDKCKFRLDHSGMTFDDEE